MFNNWNQPLRDRKHWSKDKFILQEIGRELNTICSKSNKFECTKLALDARAELDKLREQSLNIE